MIEQSEQESSAHQSAARWAVTLCEPLVSTRRRMQCEEEMAHLAVSNPKWISIWFSGVIAEHLATLPAEDPWRNLSISTAASGRNAPSVLLPSGEPFGAQTSWNDLLNQNVADLSTDVAVAAVAEGLDAESRLLIARASQGWESARLYLDSLIEEPDVIDPLWTPTRLFDVAADSLRWVMHRRRTYSGSDDVFSVLSLFGWLRNADLISSSLRWDEATSAELIEDQKIADGSWERFRINV